MDRIRMVDDTPVSSTVSTGAVRAGAVSAATHSEPESEAPENTPAQPVLPAPTAASGDEATPQVPTAMPHSDAPPGQSGVAPARPSSPSTLFEPTSEEEAEEKSA